MAGIGRSLARLATVFLVLMGLGRVASAQTSAPAPAVSSQSAFLGASFAQSFQGREVWITTSTGPRLKARLGVVAPSGLNVTAADGQGRTIPFGEITRIEKSTHRIRNHMIAGAIIGGGLGFVGLFACDGDPGCAATAFGFYAGIGVGIGALNGAIRNSVNRDDDLIYQAGVRTTTAMTVAPILSRERKGVSLSLAWR
jgi:hypothetical protein